MLWRQMLLEQLCHVRSDSYINLSCSLPVSVTTALKKTFDKMENDDTECGSHICSSLIAFIQCEDKNYPSDLRLKSIKVKSQTCKFKLSDWICMNFSMNTVYGDKSSYEIDIFFKTFYPLSTFLPWEQYLTECCKVI